LNEAIDFILILALIVSVGYILWLRIRPEKSKASFALHSSRRWPPLTTLFIKALTGPETSKAQALLFDVITTLRILMIYKLYDFITRKHDIVQMFPSHVNGLIWGECRAALLGKGSVLAEGGDSTAVEAAGGKSELQSLVRPIA
jgi:hypothetical protein